MKSSRIKTTLSVGALLLVGLIVFRTFGERSETTETSNLTHLDIGDWEDIGADYVLGNDRKV